MADKSIPELPAVEEKHIQDLPQLQEIYDDTLIPVSQNNEAHKMTGAQFRAFGEKTAEVYVQTAVDAAASAKADADRAKGYADTIQIDYDYIEQARTDAQASAEAAKESETAAKNSQTAAAGSASAAKTSQDAAAASAAAAKASQDAAKESQTAAEGSAAAAQESQTAAAGSADQAKAQADRAEGYADTIQVDYDYIEKAKSDVQANAAAAKESENAAKASQEAAAKSETNAANSASSASTSETAAAKSMESAKESEEKAAASQAAAASSEAAAATSEANAKDSKTAAKASETNAAKSETASEAAAKTAQSYAVGGTQTRENEDVDNARYYYDQAKHISKGLAGALLPMGTIDFEQLSAQSKEPGYMYNIRDSFVTDDSFVEGTGHTYPAGTNVYYTADGFWDCLAGTQVVSVAGRTGVVVLTKADVGLGQVDNTPDSKKSVASAATATKVGHDLTFAGAVTGSWNGSEAKTVRIPNSAADVGAYTKAEVDARSGVTSVNGQTGSVTITPDGIGAYTKAEVDARSGVTSVNGGTGAVQITPEAIGALPLTGGVLSNFLNVGRGISLRTDSEGGNIDIFPPESYPNYWEIDAYDGDLRFLDFDNEHQLGGVPLVLNRDAAKSWFGGNAATATQANHALTADTATNATAINVESTQNYNTLHSGFFFIPYTADLPENKPFHSFILLNIDAGNGYGFQMAFGNDTATPQCKVRSKTAGSWSAWKTMSLT